MCFTLPGGKIHRDSVKICIKFVLRFRAQCSSRGNRKRVLWGSSAQNQSRFNPILFFTPTPPKDHSPFHFSDEKKWFLQKDPTAHYFEMDFSFEKYNAFLSRTKLHIFNIIFKGDFDVIAQCNFHKMSQCRIIEDFMLPRQKRLQPKKEEEKNSLDTWENIFT